MSIPDSNFSLPPSDSPDLQLVQPTVEEEKQVVLLISEAWKDSLTLAQYIQESSVFNEQSLSRDGGLTGWILTVSTLPPGQRPILSSCESFVNATLVADADGNVADRFTHTIASVYTRPEWRQKGYASRMMREVRQMLRHFVPHAGGDGAIVPSRVGVGSLLYSDIGPKFYADLGWKTRPDNYRASIPVNTKAGQTANNTSKTFYRDGLAELCAADIASVRENLATATGDAKTRVVAVPDMAHYDFQHVRQDFCLPLHGLGPLPVPLGASDGPVGRRVWLVWTHRLYAVPGTEAGAKDNKLQVLRIVVEGGIPDGDKGEEVDLVVARLRNVLEAARVEAGAIGLASVDVWVPDPRMRRLIALTGVEHKIAKREKLQLTSLDWWGDDEESVDWLCNEQYIWC